jgi:hypothetical protein
MILLISDKNDKHVDRVESILQENAADYSRLNLDIESLKSTQVRMEDNSFRVEGPNCSFSTSEIEAVWNRSTRMNQFIENYCPVDKDELICNESWDKTLEKIFSLLESTKWLNFFHDLYAETQFGQYTISKNIGLKWPSSICTNDINYLNSFFENKKGHILELMDQNCEIQLMRESFGKYGGYFGTYCSNKTQENKPQIAGLTYKVRCTVVGKEYFVGKIQSNTGREGSKFEGGHQNYTVFQPPMSVRMKAIQIMSALNLTHGVFDFIVTDNDEWFFDALNPTGQYKWVEDIRGSDISSSIAKWLMTNN